MKFSEKARKAQDITRGLNQTATILVQTGLLFLGALIGEARPTSQQVHLRSTIWKLHQLLHDAMGDGMDRELVIFLNSLSQNSDEIQRAVIVWVDLIEALVQNTERRYGSKSGRGSIKAAEVKEVVRYLLRTDKFALADPTGPNFLMPVIIDIIVGSTIDQIVLMANQYGLWVDTKPSPQSFQARVVILWKRLLQFLQPLWIAPAWLVNRIWFALQERVSLSPAVQSALKAVEREGMLVDETQLFKGMADGMVWIGTHGKQLIASFELVFAAVHEAEGFLVLSGPEKKAYASDLVFAVLDDAGFKLHGGLVYAIIHALVNAAIEAAVHIFNKRAVFTHRHAT